MLELKIKAGGSYLAPRELRRKLGAERAREELGDMIEALVMQLDLIDGDPDLENDRSDYEHSGDELGDPSWCEWHTLPASTRRAGKINTKQLDPRRASPHEDEELDDWPEEDDPSGQSDEDGINTGGRPRHGWEGPLGPGCPISDPADLTKPESLYQGAGGVQWDHDDDEPRVVPNVWAAERDAYFYRPPANMN